MDTTRRSETAPGTFGPPAAAVDPPSVVEVTAAGAVGAIGVAHSAQNLAPAGFAVPQLEHGRASGAAHSVQNLAPGAFSVWQFEQVRLTGTLGTGSGGRD
jgi:hypothetical protein